MTWGEEIRMVVVPGAEKGNAFFEPDDGVFYVHEFDYLLQVGKGRLPYETSRSLGMRELERDRRRHPRA